MLNSHHNLRSERTSEELTKVDPEEYGYPRKKFDDNVGAESNKEKLPSPEKVIWRLPSERKEEVYVQKGIT